MRRGEVVFDRVAVAHDLGPLQARDQANHLVLHVARQAGRDAVDVNLVGRASLGLEKQLMPILVGEADDLVFDRRAIARAARTDLAAVHRCPVQIRANPLVDRFVGVGDPARDLLDRKLIGQKRERRAARRRPAAVRCGRSRSCGR